MSATARVPAISAPDGVAVGWQDEVVSLTSHIDDKDSPIRAFFERAFPNTRDLRFADTDEPATSIPLPSGVIEAQTSRRFAAPPASVLPEDRAGYPWALAGTAFDYRLRYELEVADPETLTAFLGWKEIVRRPFGELAPDSGWTSLVEAIDNLFGSSNPTAASLGHNDDHELSRMCGLLAMYEQIYRMGGILNPHTQKSRLFEVGLDAPLVELLNLVDDRVPTDLVRLAALYRASAKTLTGETQLVCNPEFARSRDLGGADADIILDHTLVELKAIKNANLSKAYVWQVLGYLLSDTDDEYGITSVGWYFARQGYWWTFPVDEFLRRLSGEATSLQDARAEFADVCASLRRRVPPAGSFVAPGRESAPRLLYPVGGARQVERAVKFYPPSRGKGRWHVPLSEVPRNIGLYDDPDLHAAACGVAVPLDIGAKPHIPAIGTLVVDIDDAMCGNCRVYADAFYGPESAVE